MDGMQDPSEVGKGQMLWLRGIARLQTQVKKNNKLIVCLNEYLFFFQFFSFKLTL